MKGGRVIINAFNYIAIAAIVAMLAITVADIIGRLLFTRPITGTIEFCEMLMAVMLTAMGGSLLAGKNIKVDVLLDALPKKIALKIETIVLFLTGIFCFFAFWATFLNGRYAYNTNRSYSNLGIPKWPFIMLLAMAFIIAGVVSLYFIVMLYKRKEEDAARVQGATPGRSVANDA